MYKLAFSFVLLANSVNAASISTFGLETCDGGGAVRRFCGTGGPPGGLETVSVEVGPLIRGQFGWESDVIQGDVSFTVTGGLGQGFFAPCFEVSQDYFYGTANASATFGQATFSIPFKGIQDGCGSEMSFTLGVPQTFAISLSAYASAGTNLTDTAQANAGVGLTGFEFFDSSQNPVSGADYSLSVVAPFPVPEPADVSLLLCGLLVLAFMCRMNLSRPSHSCPNTHDETPNGLLVG